jgi:hypothetical protein
MILPPDPPKNRIEIQRVSAIEIVAYILAVIALLIVIFLPAIKYYCESA